MKRDIKGTHKLVAVLALPTWSSACFKKCTLLVRTIRTRRLYIQAIVGFFLFVYILVCSSEDLVVESLTYNIKLECRV